MLGLNPHAGEHGLLGAEEQTIIQPALQQLRARGLQISDPLPPDTAFLPHLRQQFDGYIAHYHDQGLIPFKTLCFATGVNSTLNLPIIRTSVDHGTAGDIAWQGHADASVPACRLALSAKIVQLSNRCNQCCNWANNWAQETEKRIRGN